MHQNRQGRGSRIYQLCSNDVDTRTTDQREKQDVVTDNDAKAARIRLFLDMSELLSRNMLVNTSSKEIKACRKMLSDGSLQDVISVRKCYEELLAKCIAQDHQLDRSDSLSHGKVRDWKLFCKDCARLLHLRYYIFQIPPLDEMLVKCINEEEVRLMEAALRSTVLLTARITPFYEKVQPEGSYDLPMGCLLKWNTYVRCTGQQLIECYNTVLPSCQLDQADATARFHALLTECARLDAIVAPVNANHEDGRKDWQSLCEQGLHLLMLRRALYEICNYDPCQAMIEALEHAHRIPAPRKLMNRLQLTSQTSSTQLTVRKATDTHGTLAAKVGAAMDDIKTAAHGDNSFICLISDKTVYMLRNSWPKRTMGLAPGVMLVLHVVGLVDGDIDVAISTTDLVLAFEELKRGLYTDTAYADVLNDVLAVNTDQLANLEQIGVHDASKKLLKFKEDLVRLLCLKQIKHNTPVIARLEQPMDLHMTPAITVNPVVRWPQHYNGMRITGLLGAAGYVLTGCALLASAWCTIQLRQRGSRRRNG